MQTLGWLLLRLLGLQILTEAKPTMPQVVFGDIQQNILSNGFYLCIFCTVVIRFSGCNSALNCCDSDFDCWSSISYE